jgi:hypothetical protein
MRIEIIMRIVYITLILFFIGTTQIRAQDIPENTKARNNFSFQLLGPELLGFYYNHYLNQQLSLNAGLGYGLNSHIGINYYPFKVNPVRFYIGGQACLLTEVNLDDLVSNYGSQFAIYFPIGLQYTAPKGFTLHFECGYNLYKEDYSQRNTKPFLYTIRIGKTWFKKK